MGPPPPKVEIDALDQPGVRRLGSGECGVVQPALAAGRRLDDDVGGDGQRGDVDPLQVHRPLAGGEVGEARAALRIGDTADERPATAQRVAAARLDLDHVGAEVGQQPAGVRRSEVVAQLQHADAGEWLRRRTHPVEVVVVAALFNASAKLS